MNKTALITGASSGIGKELAKIHAKNGGNLVMVARSGNTLKALKQAFESAHNISVLVIEKDLTKENAASEVYEEVISAGITVDYLINNAGFGGIGNFHERKWQDDLDMIKLNIIALTELTRKFLPDMVARKSGKILNVSSTASKMPGPLQAVYYATKAYVTSFSNAIAQEVESANVTVTTLMPGATETGFGEVSGMDKTVLFKKTASATTVAQDGYDGMMEGKLDVISGITTSQKIMLASLPITPKKIVLKMVHKMQQPDE